MQIADRPPLVYRVCAHLAKRKYRGSTRLLKTARSLGLFDYVVPCAVTDTVSVHAPLYTDNLWDEASIGRYESALLSRFAAEAASLPGPLTLIDCGASFGLFSVKLFAGIPSLTRIVAFEPNPQMFDVLSLNLGGLETRAEARNSAVSDFMGQGRLHAPDYDSSPDAQYLVRSSSGEIPVTTVDALELEVPGGLILKIDVEGGEQEVLQGALSTLARAEAFLITIEANPRVARRTGRDPLDCVRMVQKIRPCTVYVAEEPRTPLRIEEPLFDQIPDSRVRNLICRSTPAQQ